VHIADAQGYRMTHARIRRASGHFLGITATMNKHMKIDFVPLRSQRKSAWVTRSDPARLGCEFRDSFVRMATRPPNPSRKLHKAKHKYERCYAGESACAKPEGNWVILTRDDRCVTSAAPKKPAALQRVDNSVPEAASDNQTKHQAEIRMMLPNYRSARHREHDEIIITIIRNANKVRLYIMISHRSRNEQAREN
jgi:hypothetical protein